MSFNGTGRRPITGRSPSNVPGLKGLNKAKTFDELLELAGQMNEQKMKKSLPYLNRCIKLAEEARDSRDEETEFMLLHKFMTLLSNSLPELAKLQGTEKNKLNKASSEAERRYLEVRKSLKTRYEQLNKSVKNMNEVDSNGNIPRLAPLTPMETNDIAEPPEKRHETQAQSMFISCGELHRLISGSSNRGSVLIVDSRTTEDFEKCKLNILGDRVTIINLPQNSISRGLSAAKVKSLLRNSFVSSWERRNCYDIIILIDENSQNLNPGTPLEHIYNSMTKWDPNTVYKSPPKILVGGIEELVATYPFMLTNPTRFTSSTPKESSRLNTLGSFSYPEEMITESQPTSNRPNAEVARTPDPPVTIEDVNISVQRLPSPQIFDENPPFVMDDLEAGDPVLTGAASLLVNLDALRKLKPIDAPVPSIDNMASSSSSSSSFDEHSAAPRPSVNLDLKELRKNKPDFKPSKHSIRRDDGGDSNESTYHEPLKTDSNVASGSRLRRTSSSPNISRAVEEEVSSSLPFVDRKSKPSTPSILPFRQQNYTFGEGLDVIHGKTYPGLTGLKNFANNCYMNSIVQCLSNTKPLVSHLVSLNKPGLNSQSRTRGKVAQELMKVFQCMWSGSFKICSIKELKSLMGNMKDIFKGNAHQDSNEFLVILLEHLHDDLNVPAESGTLLGAEEATGEKAWGEFKRKNCSIIQQLFYGQHRSSVMCNACGHVSFTFEQFFNLYVPIPSSDSSVCLEDCLRLYMKGEKITGWTCPKCNTKREALKKLDISRLPPILVIALKRFTQEDGSWLRKKEKLVHYKLESLDMSQFVVPGSEQRFLRYNLYAASIHSGTLQSGHYRAICKNSDNLRWYMFDDQSVEPLPSSVVESNPEVYILFYSAHT